MMSGNSKVLSSSKKVLTTVSVEINAESVQEPRLSRLLPGGWSHLIGLYKAAIKMKLQSKRNLGPQTVCQTGWYLDGIWIVFAR